MTWFLGLVILLLIAGIILLKSGHSPLKKTSREESLQSLAKFVEGRLEPMAGQTGGFRIRFTLEDQEFIYEDVPEKGFGESAYKGCLKAETGRPFSLMFTEKERGGMARLKLIIPSQIPDEPSQAGAKLDVPESLKDLNIHTNNPAAANKLLGDRKVLSFFTELKNIDNRGHALMPFKIMDGAVILEFQSLPARHPSLQALYNDISVMDVYLDKLLVFIKKLKEE